MSKWLSQYCHSDCEKNIPRNAYITDLPRDSFPIADLLIPENVYKSVGARHDFRFEQNT